MAERAFSNAKSQNIDIALTSLNDALNNCQSYDDNKVCRTIIYYNIAYLKERQYQSSKDPEFLDQAMASYREILDYYPNEKRTLEKIVDILIEKEQADSVILLLKKLQNLYPGDQYRYTLQLSRALRIKGNTRESLYEAQKVIQIDPFKEQGWRNLVNIYKNNNASSNYSMDNAIAYAYECNGFGYTHLALQALEDYINNNFSQNERAEIALVHWVNLLVENNLLSLNRLRLIPSPQQWPARSNRELQYIFYLDTINDFSLEHLENLQYWNSTNQIRMPEGEIRPYIILTKVIKSFGQQKLAAGNVLGASRYFETAIDLINNYNPSPRNTPIVYFKVAGQLADLYFFNPELDPDDSKFKDLTRELITGKGMAYRAQDNQTIKQYHVTLGIIYARKNIWKSTGIDNAHFQLNRALRYKNDHEYMPYINELLAEGYLNQLNSQEKAVSEYLNAARNYLMLDDIENTEKVLKILNDPEFRINNRKDITRFRSYNKIIRIRTKLKEELNQLSTREYFSRLKSIRRQIDELPVDQEFRNYQTFKIMSSAGDMISGQNASYKKIFSYNMALKALENLTHLTNYNDLVKLQQIKNFMTEKMKFADSDIIEINKYNPGYRSNQANNKHNYLYVDENNQFNIGIPQAVFDAGALGVYFYQQDQQRLPEILIQNDQVVIQKDRDDLVQERMADEIKSVVKGKKVIIR